MSPPHDNANPHTVLKDFYDSLGVPRKASAREIRRAYRELARKYHPDFNPGDATAAEKFREVQEAYEVLGNSRKRKAYDYYGADFSGRVPVRAPERPAEPAPQASVRPTSPSQPRDPANVLRDFATSHRYRPAVGFPRLVSVAQIVYVTVPLVFVVGSLLYLALPDAGVRELKRSQEALRHATSWKMESRVARAAAPSGTYLEEFNEEVSCPSSRRSIQRMRSTIGGQFTELTIETIIIGSERYSYNDRAKVWTHDVLAGAAAWGPCAYLQRAQDFGRMPPLARWLSDSSAIEKENLRETGEGQCREWKILIPGAFASASETQFVCLGVKDHLPRFQGSPGSPAEVRFYDWNVPIEILPPPLMDSP